MYVSCHVLSFACSYCFNVMFVFGEKLLRAYVIYYVYVPNQNRAFLSYLILSYPLMLSITTLSFVLICTISPSCVQVYYKAGDFIGQSSPVNVVDTMSLTNSWQWRLAKMISNFITLSNKTGETGGAETVYCSAASEFTLIIQRVSCCSGLWIIVCPLSFFVLSFFGLMLPFRPIFVGRLCAIINFQLSVVSLMVFFFYHCSFGPCSSSIYGF